MACHALGAPSSIIRALSDPPISRKPARPCQICHAAQNTLLFRRAICSPHTVALVIHGLVPSVFSLLQDPLLRYPDDHHAMDAGPTGIFSLLRSPPWHGRSSCRAEAFSDRCRPKGSRSTSMATIDPFLFKAKRHARSQACAPVSGHAALDGAVAQKGGLRFDPNRHQTRTTLTVTQKQDRVAAVTRWIILPKKNGRAVCRHRP